MYRVQYTTGTGGGAAFLERLFAGLQDPAKKQGVNRAIATRMEQLSREYLRREAPGRHDTAQRLGARPTGHLEKAAQRFESRATAEAAIVSFPRNTGLSRAFHRLHIEPRPPRKYLTIPVHPEAYGRRAREFDELFALNVGPRGTLVLARRLEGRGILETMYVLVKSATIKQDRTLLPSDQQYAQAALGGVKAWLDDERRRQ